MGVEKNVFVWQSIKWNGIINTPISVHQAEESVLG